MGPSLSINEVSLSNGELWTLLTNKAENGRKGTLVSAIRDTRIIDIKRVYKNIPDRLRMAVNEVSMDMAKNMEIAVSAFEKKVLSSRLGGAKKSQSIFDCDTLLNNSIWSLLCLPHVITRYKNNVK